MKGKFDTRTQKARQHKLGFGQRFMQVDRVKIEDLFSAKGQELPIYGGSLIDSALDLIQVLARGRSGWQRTLEQLAAAAKNHQHVVEVVSHTAGEPVEHFHFLRLTDLGVEGLAFANVFDESHCPIDLATVRKHRSRRDICGKALAVAFKTLSLETCGNLTGKRFCRSTSRASA
jgi:hypothetical protein